MALESYIGEISVVTFDWAPRGWMKCDGTILRISEYTALFALIGNQYGGDGKLTFALPDLRGRFPIGSGNFTDTDTGKTSTTTSYVLGNRGGSKEISLTTQHLPAHNHALTQQKVNASVTLNMKASVGNPDISNPAGAFLTVLRDEDGAPLNMFTKNETQLVDMKSSNVSIEANLQNGTTSTTGIGQSISVLNPYLVFNYIICVNGIFPDRP